MMMNSHARTEIPALGIMNANSPKFSLLSDFNWALLCPEVQVCERLKA